MKVIVQTHQMITKTSQLCWHPGDVTNHLQHP